MGNFSLSARSFPHLNSPPLFPLTTHISKYLYTSFNSCIISHELFVVNLCVLKIFLLKIIPLGNLRSFNYYIGSGY